MLAFNKTTSGTLCIFLNGKAHSVSPDHNLYKDIEEACKERNEEDLLVLLKPATVINNYTDGKVSIVNGVVMYGNIAVKTSFTKRILQLFNEGWNVAYLLRFLENLMENPSHRAQEALFIFLDHLGFPITEDGHFLGYKAVKEDWMDKHSGTVDNSPGKVISMPRNMCDDDAKVECSLGYHVGTFKYAKDFGRGLGDRFLLVKVNPRDIVSIPYDAVQEKIRTCAYEVLQEYDGDVITEPVRAADGSMMTPSGDEEGHIVLEPATMNREVRGFDEDEEEEEDDDSWVEDEEEEEEWEDDDEDEDMDEEDRKDAEDSRYGQGCE